MINQVPRSDGTSAERLVQPCQIPIFVLLKNSTLLSYTMPFPPIGQPFIVLPSVDSTNNYAMAQVQKGLARHGACFLALEQTAGKGQRGKSWLAEPGQNILMSVVIAPGKLSITEQFYLSMSVSLSCYDFFKNYGSADYTRIKWPNDVYWQDRKAGGILIESIIDASGSWAYSVAGIGININQAQFAPGLHNPVSIRQLSGKQFDVLELCRQLCHFLETRYEQVQADKQSIHHDFNRILYKRHEKVKLRKDNVVWETTIESVSADGLLHTRDQLDRQFRFGEVTWLV